MGIPVNRMESSCSAWMRMFGAELAGRQANWSMDEPNADIYEELTHCNTSFRLVHM